MSGPYIITTKRERTMYQPGDPRRVKESRRAVAALDERAIWNSLYGVEVPDREETVEKIATLPESGGTVELPDGTVIEVEAVSRNAFADMLSTFSSVSGLVWPATNDKVLAAQIVSFNAQQAR
jgi:hypothetical protein